MYKLTFKISKMDSFSTAIMIARIRLNVILQYIACIILSEASLSNNLSILLLSVAINFRKSSELIFLLQMFRKIILLQMSHKKPT